MLHENRVFLYEIEYKVVGVVADAGRIDAISKCWGTPSQITV
jgi:hypothetical protein